MKLSNHIMIPALRGYLFTALFFLLALPENHGQDLPEGAVQRLIRLAQAENKCMDLVAANTASGTNVQLYDCHDTRAQEWVIYGHTIHLAKDFTKCLDLDRGNLANGTNIQLWDCNGSVAQQWAYDGLTQTIHPKNNIDACIDLQNGTAYNDTNVQLYSCQGNNSQQWVIEGLNPQITDTHNRIKLVGDSGKCVDVQAAGTDNGTNIQVYHCTDASSQLWNFTGNTIKFEKDSTKCMDLTLSKTDNGKNIRLWECNGTNAQKWFYDAQIGAFHSWIDPNKCIDVDHSNFNDGTNIQLWDCNGTDAQKFLLEAVDPCVTDLAPPVAKCKDFQNSGNIIPRANNFDNGSYDNCAISSIDLKKIGFQQYQLTLTDAAGNSSSCTAKVY